MTTSAPSRTLRATMAIVALSATLAGSSLSSVAHADAPTLLINIDPGDLASYNPANSLSDVTNLADNQVGAKDSSITYNSDFGGYFSFPGQYNNEIDFGATDFGNAFTVEAWVRPKDQVADLGDGNINTILSNTYANLNSPGFKVEWNSWLSQDRRILIEAGNGGTYGDASAGSTVYTNENQVTTAEWQHLVYAFDNVAHTVTLYRNGNRLCTTGTPVDAIPTNNPWAIGTMIGGSYPMYGDLGTLKMYNAVLSDSQVNSDFNNSRTRYGVAATTLSAAPLNIHVPVITGTPDVGTTLSGDNGSWNNCVDTYSYEWARSTTEFGTYTTIDSATASTYTVTDSDVNKWLRYSVTAHNNDGYSSAPAYFFVQSLTPPVPPAPSIAIAEPAQIAAIKNQAITTSYNLSNTGGTIDSYTVSPELPAGLTLDANGYVVGTPTAISETQTYTLVAHGQGGDSSATFQLGVTQIPTQPTPPIPSYRESIQSFTTPAQTLFFATSTAVNATAYTLSSDAPTWLSINSSSGALTGTPPSGGTFEFIVTATNGAYSASQKIVITVKPVVAPVKPAPAPVTVLPNPKPDLLPSGSLPNLPTVRIDGVTQPSTISASLGDQQLSLTSSGFQLVAKNTTVEKPAIAITPLSNGWASPFGTVGNSVSAVVTSPTLPSNTPISLVIGSTPTEIASGFFVEGSATLSGLLPLDLEPGDHALQAITYTADGRIISFTIPFIIKAAPQTVTPGQSSAGSETTAPPVPTIITTPKSGTINFAFASSALTSSDLALVKSLKLKKGAKVIVNGYAQASAGEDDLRISLDRAIEVRKAIQKYYPTVEVTVFGLGTKKNAACASAKNRCAVVIIKK